MYVNPSPNWDSFRPYQLEEPSITPKDVRITEPGVLEELLDLLLQINSPFICVKSFYSLKEAEGTIHHPHNIEYHPAIGI